MLILFLHSVFGFTFGFRIFLNSLKKNVLKKELLTKIGTVYLFFLLLCAIFYSDNSFLYVFCVYFPLFILIFIEKFIVFYKTQQFYNLFEVFLEQVILKIRSGKSFRTAIDEVNVYLCPIFKNKLDEIMHFVVFSPQNHKNIKDLFIKEVTGYFISVEKNKHRSVEILEKLNSNIKKRENFRRRSKVTSLQIRLQIFLLSIFYTFLFLFVVKKFGFIAHLNIFIISISLFITGILVIFWQLRKIRCKI